MKKLWMLIPLLTLVSMASAQATNPQRTFWSAEWSANPALAMNFSESTTAFKDQVSGSTFVGTKTTYPTGLPVPNGNTIDGFFNGSNNYLATASVTTLTPPAFSFAEWVYINAIPTSGNYATLMLITTGTTGTPTILLTSTGQLLMAVATSGGSSSYSAGSHTLAVGNWYFIAMTYSSTAGLAGYVNGAADGTGTANGTAAAVTGQLRLGGDYPGFTRNFNGQASNAVLYNVALTSPQITTLYGGTAISSGLIGQWQINEGTGSTAVDSSGAGNNMTWHGTAAGNSGYYNAAMGYSSGTVTTQQPGFDATNNSNYSAGYTYNSWSAAPNNTLSAIDWNSPWSMLIHIDNFNWDRTGTLVLASKGDLTGCLTTITCGTVTGTFWKVTVSPNSTSGTLTGAQLCFSRNGFVTSASLQSYQYVCSTLGDAMPNGMNYDIVIEDTGTGSAAGLSMYLNGLAISQTASTTTTGSGFGGVTVALASGGTGYAASTTFTNGGTGGPTCLVQGTATATSGVITSIGITPGYNYGCTSTPTISFVSPTGTGGSITATAYSWTMNSSTSALMVPGFVSNGVVYGVGGGDTSQNPVYVDEFAQFNADLTFGQVTNLFYSTKFWQSLIYPGLLANPPLVILGGYGCGPDFSGDQTLAMTIGAAKQGLIHLIGVVDDDGNPNGSNSVGWWRQMLDQAGLNDVPVSTGANSPDANLGGCPAATITAYNASTPQNASSYPSTITMYRTLFAQYPTTPIYILATQTGNGYAAFLTSPADSISPLTGLQLQAQNAANGGWVNMYQGNLSLTPTGYATIWNNNGTMPIYIFGGTPSTGGPGIEASRTSNDPLYLNAANQATDYISGYTQLNLAQVLSPYFYGGVTITYSGGTGYANSTPFTSTGGGPYCHVTGIMTASGGVPNGINTYFNNPFPASTTYNGLGYGCFSNTSPPTIVLTAPTGTGVTLTATPGVVPTCYGTSGCVDQYVLYPNLWSVPQSTVGVGQVFSWFQNSLMDPPPNGAPRPY